MVSVSCTGRFEEIFACMNLEQLQRTALRCSERGDGNDERKKKKGSGRVMMSGECKGEFELMTGLEIKRIRW